MRNGDRKIFRRREKATSEEEIKQGYVIDVTKRSKRSEAALHFYEFHLQILSRSARVVAATKFYSLALREEKAEKVIKNVKKRFAAVLNELRDEGKLKKDKLLPIAHMEAVLSEIIEVIREENQRFKTCLNLREHAPGKYTVRLLRNYRGKGVAAGKTIYFPAYSANDENKYEAQSYKDAEKLSSKLLKMRFDKAEAHFMKVYKKRMKFPGKWRIAKSRRSFYLLLHKASTPRVRALTGEDIKRNCYNITLTESLSKPFVQLLSNVFVYHALSADDMAAIIVHQKTLYSKHEDRRHLMNVIETGLAKGVEFFESYYVNEKACEYWLGFLEVSMKLMHRQVKSLCRKGLTYVPQTKDWQFIEQLRSVYYFIENLPKLPLKGEVKKNYQALIKKAQAARALLELKFKKHVFISLSLDAELLKKPYADRIEGLFFSLEKAVEHAYQSAPLAQVHISAAEDFLHHAVTDLPGFETQIDAFLRKHPNVVLHLPVRSAENVVIDCLDEAYDDKLKALKAECESAREINREYENEGAVDEYLRDLEGTIKAADSGYYVTRQLMIRAFVQNDEVQVHKTPKKMMVFEGGNDFNPYREFDYIGFEADAVFSPAIEGESANWIEKGKQWFATAICLDEKQGVVEHTRPVLTEKEAADAIYIVPANGAKKGGHEVRLAGNYAYAVHIDQRHGAYFAAGNKVKAREAVCFDANVVSVGDVFSLTEKPFDLVAPSIEKGLPAEMVLPGIDGILAYFGLGRPVEKMADIDDESASDDDEYVGDSSDEEGEVLAEPVSPLAGAGAGSGAGAGAGSGEGAYVFAKTSLDKAKPSPRPAKKVKISQKGVDPAAA